MNSVEKSEVVVIITPFEGALAQYTSYRETALCDSRPSTDFETSRLPIITQWLLYILIASSAKMQRIHGGGGGGGEEDTIHENLGIAFNEILETLSINPVVQGVVPPSSSLFLGAGAVNRRLILASWRLPLLRVELRKGKRPRQRHPSLIAPILHCLNSATACLLLKL